MSAININHDTETITTENDTILNIGAKGGIKLGDGTNVNPVGNKGVLRFDTVNDKLQVSNGVDWQDAALLITEVDTDNIADGAVTNEKIANGEITEDKLEPSFVSDILRSSNNLSEIIDKGLARDNLGISTSTIHDVFIDGVDFTAGSIDQDLTLSVAPKQLINCMVFFDAVYQAPETMTLTGNIITVDVPAGVSKIYVTYSENYVKTIGIPDDGFINTYTNKSTLVGNDELLLGNSEDGNKTYKTSITNLRNDVGGRMTYRYHAGSDTVAAINEFLVVGTSVNNITLPEDSLLVGGEIIAIGRNRTSATNIIAGTDSTVDTLATRPIDYNKDVYFMIYEKSFKDWRIFSKIKLNGTSNNPLFIAYKSAGSTETGDNTTYTVICDTEIADVCGDYDNTTGIFTASQTGYYEFSAMSYLRGFEKDTYETVQYWIELTDGMNAYFLSRDISEVGGSINDMSVTLSTMVLMDAGDTARFKILVSNGTKSIQVMGGINNTRFWGRRVQ